MIKTIWQPVPKWDIPLKQLDRSKYPKRKDELKRERVNQNDYRKWIFNL
jgi:hypothetical protein